MATRREVLVRTYLGTSAALTPGCLTDKRTNRQWLERYVVTDRAARQRSQAAIGARHLRLARHCWRWDLLALQRDFVEGIAGAAK